MPARFKAFFPPRLELTKNCCFSDAFFLKLSGNLTRQQSKQFPPKIQGKLANVETLAHLFASHTFHYDRESWGGTNLVHAFALLCSSTVLQVLSAAWQIFSSRQSTHLGLRAIQSLRPCQM